MDFTQYFVIGAAINVFPGQLLKGLTDEQIRRRKNFLKIVDEKKGVYECVSPFQFKSGEVVCLDPKVVCKSSLQVLHDPNEIELEQPEEKSIFDDMTKLQIVAWAEKRKGLKLDMKMTKAEMLDELKTIPDEKPESKKVKSAPA